MTILDPTGRVYVVDASLHHRPSSCYCSSQATQPLSLYYCSPQTDTCTLYLSMCVFVQSTLYCDALHDANPDHEYGQPSCTTLAQGREL